MDIDLETVDTLKSEILFSSEYSFINRGYGKSNLKKRGEMIQTVDL